MNDIPTKADVTLIKDSTWVWLPKAGISLNIITDGGSSVQVEAYMADNQINGPALVTEGDNLGKAHFHY